MGRPGALVVAAVVTALGLGVLAGSRAIEGEAAYAGVGPRAFPVLIGAALTLAGLAFGAGVWRGREPLPAPEPPHRPPLGWIAGALLVAVLVIEPLGFPAAAAVVFAATARAFGSRRPARDGLVGVVVGVAVYWLFARGLGVSLPGGPLG